MSMHCTECGAELDNEEYEVADWDLAEGEVLLCAECGYDPDAGMDDPE